MYAYLCLQLIYKHIPSSWPNFGKDRFDLDFSLGMPIVFPRRSDV